MDYFFMGPHIPEGSADFNTYQRAAQPAPRSTLLARVLAIARVFSYGQFGARSCVGARSKRALPSLLASPSERLS
eukprot:4553503-Alexandrium_andersonii.AAC.1